MKKNKYADFIAKWKPVLTEWNGAAENPQFADDCQALGFKMDSGDSLTKAFPDQDVLRAKALKKILPQITGRQFLGTAIFSYWRDLTHWHEAPLPDDAIEWFTLAFERLTELSENRSSSLER